MLDLIVGSLKVLLEDDAPGAFAEAVSEKLGLNRDDFSITKILSKALDLRNPEQFHYNVSLVIRVNEGFENKAHLLEYSNSTATQELVKKPQYRPIIIGFGPAGMFAALELIELGIKPIIFERGKKIEERTADVQRFIKERHLNPESNIQFGEGGAGSYSDGKLFSRRNNNTSHINRVLKTYARFGAPAEIEYISKPHLGTDVLCKIVKNIRTHILEHGGEIHYESKMTDLLIADGKAEGVVINGDQEYLSSHIYMALGHSARETVTMMHDRGVSMEQRSISVGVRVEHPVETINLMRHGEKYHEFPGLGAATYSLNYTDRKIKRGVYTFCMCPGGEVVNAASSPGELVINGMSYSRRSLPYSNAALVVSCHVDDYPSMEPLAGFEFQKEIEQKAFRAGGANWQAPAQNLMNFLGLDSVNELHENSFKMGLAPAEMKDVFPEFITKQLVSAFDKWKDQVPLFVSHEAILIGCETRTSSPVRIIRNENFESVNIKNLFPIGEGAGYTGGITSSAGDAIKAVTSHFTSS